jgi:hypothetical protein
MRLPDKVKYIYRKDRKEIWQRSQSQLIQRFNFALFADTLRSLRLQKAFETPLFHDFV